MISECNTGLLLNISNRHNGENNKARHSQQKHLTANPSFCHKLQYNAMGASEEAAAALKNRLSPLESEQIVAGGLGSGIAQVPFL